MSESQVVIDDRGPVRWLWLNRPEKRNAQGVQLLTALEKAVLETRDDPAVRVVVLAGRGPSFSAGHDLKEAVTNPTYRERARSVEGRMWQEQEVFVRPIEALRDLRVPTVCRVQGHCIAAAMMLVGAADLVVCAEDAVFASHVTRDLGAADVELPTLAWQVGPRMAKQLMWTGESLSGLGAVAAGLANWAVPAAELDDKVTEVVDAVLRVPREAIALSKMSMRFEEDRRGRSDAFAYHFMAHQLSHATSECAAIRDARIAALEN